MTLDDLKKMLDDEGQAYLEILDNARRVRGQDFVKMVRLHQYLISMAKVEQVRLGVVEAGADPAPLDAVSREIQLGALLLLAKELRMSADLIKESISVSATLTNRLNDTAERIVKGK